MNRSSGRMSKLKVFAWSSLPLWSFIGWHYSTVVCSNSLQGIPLGHLSSLGPIPSLNSTFFNGMGPRLGNGFSPCFLAFLRGGIIPKSFLFFRENFASCIHLCVMRELSCVMRSSPDFTWSSFAASSLIGCWNLRLGGGLRNSFGGAEQPRMIELLVYNVGEQLHGPKGDSRSGPRTRCPRGTRSPRTSIRGDSWS